MLAVQFSSIALLHTEGLKPTVFKSGGTSHQIVVKSTVKFDSQTLVQLHSISTTQHSTAQHSTARCSTAQHSKSHHGMAWHGPVQTAQHSTAQHSTAQHSTARHGTARHGTSQHITGLAMTHPSHSSTPIVSCTSAHLPCCQLPNSLPATLEPQPAASCFAMHTNTCRQRW